MLNIIKKIIVIIFSLFYFISSANSMIIIDEEMKNLKISAEVIKKKIARYDFNPYIGTTLFNNEIKLTSKINDSTKVLSHIGAEFNLNEDIEMSLILSKLKVGYIEIKNDKYGSISYGKNYGAIRDVYNVSNEIPCFNNNFNKFDHFMFNKSNNLFSYKNENLFDFVKGLKFNIQYQGKNYTQNFPNSLKLIKHGNGHGFGASSSYKIKDFKVLGGYFKSKRTDDQMMIDVPPFINKHASAYAVACNYDTDNIYLSALYGINYFVTPYGNINNTYIRKIFEDKSVLRKYYYCGYAPSANTLELTSKYRFKCGLHPYMAYFKTFAKCVKNDLDQYLSNFISLGINYILNDDVSVYIGYKINFIRNDKFTEGSKINTANCIGMGFTYKF